MYLDNYAGKCGLLGFLEGGGGGGREGKTKPFYHAKTMTRGV